ncbi:outer envelope protein 61-like [Primulina huaijiensis]|uniref:outer envelope protein 61-like n=1 Tax=Primulina huaijiensis TaxID=1492673 RepID=UPI003CC7200C
MVKNAANVIGKMSPEELQRMFQLASSFQGDHAYTKTGSPFSPGSVPPDLSPELLSTTTDMMSKLSPEELQKMFDMVSSMKGNEGSPSSSSTAVHSYPGSVPPNVTPEMIKMATDMMSKMSPEEPKIFFEIASSLRGQDGPSSTADLSTTRENFNVNDNDVDESSSSQGLHSGSTPQLSFLGSTADLPEQMKSQMKDPAMRQMLTTMMKNMSPEMMANMSEQFGFKLSREDAERAQQAMSSLSPDTLDIIVRHDDLKNGLN